MKVATCPYIYSFLWPGPATRTAPDWAHLSADSRHSEGWTTICKFLFVDFLVWFISRINSLTHFLFLFIYINISLSYSLSFFYYLSNYLSIYFNFVSFFSYVSFYLFFIFFSNYLFLFFLYYPPFLFIYLFSFIVRKSFL